MNYLMSHQTLNDAFNTLATTALVNGVPQKVIVTTAYLGEAEKRHVSSLESFKQGDYVEYDGVTCKRQFKHTFFLISPSEILDEIQI